MMTDGLLTVAQSPEDILRVTQHLRHNLDTSTPLPLDALFNVLEAWSSVLGGAAYKNIDGLPFLRLWLRRNTLQPIIVRELGEAVMADGWALIGKAFFQAFPVGIVGHWPAGNIQIQPFLSLICTLLGGNSCLVRIPTGIVDEARLLCRALKEADVDGRVSSRVALVSFGSEQRECHEAMARNVDGAMIWGGEEAVLNVRSLPFPHWAKLAVFGPRVSVAMFDAGVCEDDQIRAAWCRRLTRDVWQFDQQACSSPQVLFVETSSGAIIQSLLDDLKRAFEEENRAHPRTMIEPALTSMIVNARAMWVMGNDGRTASYPIGPCWTLLTGPFEGRLPEPIQGRTLYVLQVENLEDAIACLDGNVQTLGVGMVDTAKELALANLGGRRGLDRIVKIGRMHAFDSPWDGQELIKPMVRLVRHLPVSN